MQQEELSTGASGPKASPEVLWEVNFPAGLQQGWRTSGFKSGTHSLVKHFTSLWPVNLKQDL